MGAGRRSRTGRPPEAGKKAALRDLVLAYALAHGVADLSLRPLARAVGTSARMLVYHFGSREAVLVAILEGLRERENAVIEEWWKAGGAGRSISEFVLWYWKRLSSRRARPAVRLVFELYAMALRDPGRFPGVLENPVDYWKRLTRRARGRQETDFDARATLALGAVRGLLLDLAASGDRVRVGKGVEMLARTLAPRQAGRRRD